MVAFPEAPVVDVVVLVEDTALGSTNIQELRASYLLPALEHFNGGPAQEVEFASLECSSTFSLVPFRASDCMPDPPARLLGPFTSIKKVLTCFDRLRFSGGRGDNHSSGQEGLAAALEIFQGLEAKRPKDLATTKHVVYMCNSPCYDMPVIENTMFHGKSMEELCGLLVEQQVHLSIITPRKLPFFYKLYEKCGGDLAAAKEKNYSRDPRHLVLLRGFALEERALTPKPAQVAQPGPVVHTVTVASAPQQQQPGAMMSQQPVRPPGPPVGTQQPMQPNHFRPLQQQPGPGQQQQQPGTVLGSLLTKQQQQPSAQQARPGQPQPSLLTNMLNQPPQSLNSRPLGMQGMGQQQPQPVTIQQQQQPNPMQPMAAMQQQQQQPGAMGSSMQPQLPTQGTMGMGPRGPVVQGGPREREVIWKGELEWQEKVKAGPGDQKISHSVACTVSTSKEGGVPEVKPDNWPNKLIMQLIPKTLVQTIGGEYFRNSKSVLFHPSDCESLEALTKVMGTGFAGCVHFTGPCDIKVLILLYSNDKKAYLGFIPNDQTSFVERIRTVIQKQKQGQQQQQPGQPGRAMGPGGMGPGPGMQMNMPQQQQQGMMGGQQGMMMAGQQGMMGQRMMMGGSMGGQQQIIRSGPGMGVQTQYVRMSGGPQAGMGGQQMGSMQPGGMTPGLRQILQQQPGMMPQGGGGVMMQGGGMQGGQGMMLQQRPGMMQQGGGMMQGQGQGGIMPGQGGNQQTDPMLRELLN